jgi:hypothetical protein
MVLTFEEFKAQREQGLTTRDLVAQTQAQSQAPQEQEKPVSGVEKIGDFFGVSGLGRGIGASLLTFTDKEYKKISKKMKEGESLDAGELAYMTSIGKDIPTNREIAGSALQTAATVGLLGAKPVASIRKGMAKVGGWGAVSGAGRAIAREEATTGDVIKQAFTSGATSAATYGILRGAGRVAKGIWKKLPTKLMQSTAKLEKESAEALLNAKQWGTLGKLRGYAEQESKHLDELIRKKIVANNGTINAQDFVSKTVKDIQTKFPGYSTEKINRVLKNAGIDPILEAAKKKATISFVDADAIRRNLGAVHNTINKTTLNKGAQEIIWKNLVNTYRGPTETVGLFKQYAPLVKASKSIAKIMETQAKRTNISPGDFLTGGVMGGLGYSFGGPLGAATGIAAQTTPGRTATAVSIDQIGKLIAKIPTDSAGKISKSILINILKGQQ